MDMWRNTLGLKGCFKITFLSYIYIYIFFFLLFIFFSFWPKFKWHSGRWISVGYWETISSSGWVWIRFHRVAVEASLHLPHLLSWATWETLPVDIFHYLVISHLTVLLFLPWDNFTFSFFSCILCVCFHPSLLLPFSSGFIYSVPYIYLYICLFLLLVPHTLFHFHLCLDVFFFFFFWKMLLFCNMTCPSIIKIETLKKYSFSYVRGSSSSFPANQLERLLFAFPFFAFPRRQCCCLLEKPQAFLCEMKLAVLWFCVWGWTGGMVIFRVPGLCLPKVCH